MYTSCDQIIKNTQIDTFAFRLTLEMSPAKKQDKILQSE